MKKTVVILVVLVLLLMNVIPASAGGRRLDKLVSVDTENRIIRVCFTVMLYEFCDDYDVAEDAKISFAGEPGFVELSDLPTDVFIEYTLKNGIVIRILVLQ